MSGFKDKMATAEWHSEPPKWGWNGDVLSMTTGNETDFWQGTYYGFHRDDGHFLGLRTKGDFTAELTFDAKYQTLYDQAGLMVRRDSQNWVKAGIEFSDGIKNFSVVITRDGQSDWSVIGAAGLTGPQKIRLTKVGNGIIVHHMSENGWQLMRLGQTPLSDKVFVGPTTCSPQRSGLKAQFWNLEIKAPIDDPLHAN